jgi:hypothetical protein
MSDERMQAAIRELQDAMVVMAHIEKRQSEILKVHTEHLAEIDEYRRRTDQNLAEITDKLNGLIGYVAGQRPDGGLKQ